MKKLIVLVAACIFTINVMAQDTKSSSSQNAPAVKGLKYCAELKDGAITMTQDKNVLTVDVTLANGTTVKTDGTVITKDGTQTILKNGECVDNTGNLIIKDGKKEDKMPPK